MVFVEDGVLVVVGRGEAGLYEYFRWGFASAPKVSIVLDRRYGERRARARDEAADRNRRSVERRRRGAGSRAELLARGFLLVRRDRLAGRPDREGRR